MKTVIDSLSNKNIEPIKLVASGRVTRVTGLTLQAKGLSVGLGVICHIHGTGHGGTTAEVVGFDGEVTYLMPLTAADTILPGASVTPIRSVAQVPAGPGMLGRVVDGLGEPIDGQGAIDQEVSIDAIGLHINPLQRSPITEPLDTGIRGINSLLTVGRGQRIGLFAGSGVGKSVLLGMITRFTEADVVVVALVGERGREVREFIEHNLGDEGMKKTVVVAAPADETPVVRLKAGFYATRLAEYYRDQGANTLLLFDSLTRFAQAQREIALASGEPPATRGYPPSVFSKLPELVERAGNGNDGGGSITAIYTVLTEGDDLNDPVAESARAILDGHIVLSRELASEGVYPAVDVSKSISRVMNQVVEEQHIAAAAQVKQWVARYDETKDLLNIGAYVRGADEITDQSVDKHVQIRTFLSQSINESVSFRDSVASLVGLIDVSQGSMVGAGVADNSGQMRAADSQQQAPQSGDNLQGDEVLTGQATENLPTAVLPSL